MLEYWLVPAHAHFRQMEGSSKKPVEVWDNNDVLAYLFAIDLEALVPLFKAQQVQGEDLVMLTETELKNDLNISRLQALRIKRHLHDAGANYQKGSVEATNDKRLSNPGADVPFAEAPDLVDRNALRAVVGSFSRMTAIGVPVAAAAVDTSTAAVVVDAATVQRYGESIALIAQLEREQVMVRLPAARDLLGSLDQSLKAEQSKFNEIAERQAKAQGKADELEEGAWFPGKFLMGKKKQEDKIGKAQGAAADVARKVEASGAVLESLHVKRAAQAKLVNELTAKASQLQQARQWEESVLPHIFTGPNGGARENALEQEVESLLPRLQQTRQFQTSYSQAYELTRGARKKLEQADELFQAAFGMARLDVMQDFMKPRPMHNTPMGRMADIAKRAQSRQGSQLANAACDALVKAKAIIPDMPRIDLQQVKALRGIGVVDMMFDNIVSDMVAKKKIQAALRQVQSMKQDALHAERWLESWLSGRVREDLRATEQLYAAKKAELDAYRRDLMNRAVQAQVMAASVTAAQPPPQQPAPAVLPSYVYTPGAPIPNLL